MHEWVRSLQQDGESASHTVSRLLEAARAAGVTSAQTKLSSTRTLEGFAKWLGKRKRDKLASSLSDLLTAYLKEG